jgi:hypothetical protein
MGTCGLLVSGCAADASLEVVDLASSAIVGEEAQAQDPRRPIVLVAGMTQDEETVAPLATALRAKGFDGIRGRRGGSFAHAAAGPVPARRGRQPVPGARACSSCAQERP